MKRLFLTILLLLVSFSAIVKPQNDTQTDSTKSIEIYLIDAYVKPEPPFTFILSFYTSEVCLSNVIIDGKYEFVVSNGLSEAHSAKIDLTGLRFLNKDVDFVIETIDSLGNKNYSEVFDFDLPYEPIIKEGSTLWTLCLFAGSVFVVPAPGYVNADGKNYFSLTKEIPVISFRAKNRNYPASYFSFEYTHIFNASDPNYLRFGFKRILNIGFLEYLSPGITAYTNFKGQNGFSPEISLGLFTLFDTFTLYGRYRFNYKPGDSSANFHEINLGLYTRFFSIYF
jgi:hypothetical protein